MKENKIIKLEEKGRIEPFFAQLKPREFSKEEKERIEIIKSGKKKIVSRDFYNDTCYIGDCETCFNYDYETEKCKKNIPDDSDDECEEWDCIYDTDD